MRLGRRADEPDEHRFNMAVMGLRLAGRSNGVAALHGEVSRQMFQGLWPDVPVDEVPIGVDHQRCARPHLGQRRRSTRCFSSGIHRRCGTAPTPRRGTRARKLDDADDLGGAQRRAAASWSSFVRERLGDDLLDPDALTIGFARRFATYKRATLLLVAARAADASCCIDATARCSSCSPARRTRPTSRARR